MLHIKLIYKYIIVIIVGIVIFMLDNFNALGSQINESILFAVGIFKSIYFIRFTFNRIGETAHTDFVFSDFATFVSLQYHFDGILFCHRL
jgi:hypothetical protein